MRCVPSYFVAREHKGASTPKHLLRETMTEAAVKNETIENKVTPIPINGKRKEKKLAREAARRQEILDEATTITRPRTNQDRLTIAKADRIKLEDALVGLEAEQTKIADLLGEFNRKDAGDDFANQFAADFKNFLFCCPVSACSKSDEKVKWVLPLAISVGKTLDARGRKDCPKSKDHSGQWKIAVELFSKPEDMSGLVFCANCQPKVEKRLEEKYPQDNPRNHKLYHIDGFTFQLGRNRHRLLRDDLGEIEEEILVTMEELERNKGYIESLKKAIAKEETQKRSIDNLI